MKVYVIIIVASLVAFELRAQDNELEPVEDAAVAIGAILGGKTDAITKVRLISDTEQSMSIEVESKGFEDQEYTIAGTVLNRIKKPIAEIVTEGKILPRGGGRVELQFLFRQSARKYSSTYLESQYISLTISKSGGLLSKLDLGGENIFGDTYLYKLDKKWRISGSESMVIQVKLTPFKSAATIKP